MGIKWSTTEQALFIFFKEKGLSDNGILAFSAICMRRAG